MLDGKRSSRHRKGKGSGKGRKAARRHWYRLRPLLLALPVLHFVALLAVRLLRGDSVHPSTVVETAVFGAIVTLLALGWAWVAWWLCRRADRVANMVFCLFVVVAGVWTVGLSHARADATTILREAIDGKVAVLKEKAHAAIDEAP